MFDEFIESVREGMAIIKGEQDPSRSFHFPLDEVEKRLFHSKINAACSHEPDQEEIENMKFLRYHSKKLGKSEEWE
jgi:hypothetical protein